MSFFQNTCKPEGFGGKLMVTMMNLGHGPLAKWGLEFLDISENAHVLDCGCGGGANVKTLLKKCPQGKVEGIDYSDVSVQKARKLNAAAIGAGRCAIAQGSVAKMPYPDAAFDAVTAFETVYFWPSLPQCFGEVRRILKPGGTFLIVNEVSEKDEKWSQIVQGMTVYNDTELKTCLTQAGFHKIQIQKKNGWLCVTGEK